MAAIPCSSRTRSPAPLPTQQQSFASSTRLIKVFVAGLLLVLACTPGADAWVRSTVYDTWTVQYNGTGGYNTNCGWFKIDYTAVCSNTTWFFISKDRACSWSSCSSDNRYGSSSCTGTVCSRSFDNRRDNKDNLCLVMQGSPSNTPTNCTVSISGFRTDRWPIWKIVITSVLGGLLVILLSLSAYSIWKWGDFRAVYYRGRRYNRKAEVAAQMAAYQANGGMAPPPGQPGAQYYVTGQPVQGYPVGPPQPGVMYVQYPPNAVPPPPYPPPNAYPPAHPSAATSPPAFPMQSSPPAYPSSSSAPAVLPAGHMQYNYPPSPASLPSGYGMPPPGSYIQPQQPPPGSYSQQQPPAANGGPSNGHYPKV